MKKILLSAASFAASLLCLGQVNPSDYSGIPVLDRDLNDSANQLYSVTSHRLQTVAGLEIIDSAVWRNRGYFNPQTGLYKANCNIFNQLEVTFDRAKGASDNYEDFNLIWAGWGQNSKPTPAVGLYPFPKKVSGSASAVVVTDVSPSMQDTLYGYAVDLYSNPKVLMKMSCTQPTNIRVDLIDKNHRVSNVLAPHHLIKTANRDTIIEFRWDYRPENYNGEPDYRYEDTRTDDFNIGIAADGWAGAWWGVDAGRNTLTSPILLGRNAWKGAILLDLKNIVGVAITMEDGPVTSRHKSGVYEYDYGYSMTAVKTLTIKEMIVGDYNNKIDLTLPSMLNPTANSNSRILSVSPSTMVLGTTQTFTVTTTGKPFANGIPEVRINYGSSIANIISSQKVNDSIIKITASLSSTAYKGNYDLKIGSMMIDKAFYAVEGLINYKSISPAIAQQGQILTVSLSVSNANVFANSYNAIEFKQQSNTIFRSSSINVIDNQTIQANVFVPYSVNPGTYDVALSYYQDYEKTMYAMGAFTVTQLKAKPQITQITTAAALQGTTINVTLSGTNCSFAQVTSNVYRSVVFTNENGYTFSSNLLNCKSINNNNLSAQIIIPRDAPTGEYSAVVSEDIYVYNAYSYVYPTINKAITVVLNTELPHLLKVENAYAQQNESLTVSLSGYNTNFAASTAPIIYFEQSLNSTRTHSSSTKFYAITSTVVSSTQLSVSVTVPRMANVGYYDVKAKYVDGSILTLTRGFVINENPNRPHLVSNSISEVKQGEKVKINITAQDINFSANKTDINVIIGSGWSYVYADSIKVIDPNTVSAYIHIPDNMLPQSYPLIVTYVTNTSDYNYEYYTSPQQITVQEVEKHAEEVTIMPVANEEVSTELSVNPTITSGECTVSIPASAQVDIIDLTGNTIISNNYIAQGKYTCNIEAYPAGLYKVVIRTATDVKTVSIIKQ